MQKRSIYTAQEAAQIANVSRWTVYKWIRADGLPAMRVGQKFVIPINPFMRWLENRRNTMEPTIDDADWLPTAGKKIIPRNTTITQG